MSCSFTEKISSLIDGELSAVEARQVESHLVTCAQCAEARADFLSLRSQIANYESSLAPMVQNRALAKILSSRRRGRTASGAHGLFGWSWGSGVVALASLVIVALVSAVIGALMFGFIPSNQPQQLVINTPAPVSSPTPAPTAEPAKPGTNDKQSETPRKQAPVRKPPIVREPKPGEQFAAMPKPVRPAEA